MDPTGMRQIGNKVLQYEFTDFWNVLSNPNSEFVA